ncbi:MAG: thermostable hemolysin [Piscinibacter sp.]|nr:thermostable hemolysin [Piscinibacter sp.]
MPMACRDGDGERAAARPVLELVGPDDPRRAEVEAFIRAVYAERFGAVLRHFAPQLVALRAPGGRLVAAAGYRSADAAPLFLERYLERPVESALGTHAGGLPSRAEIVEVGHLAASQAGEGRRLILALGPHLAAQGYQWVVSTLTEELRQLFVRIGVTPLALGVADARVLGAEAADWGDYYAHRPVVLAGHLPLALRRLARRIAQEVAA